jgi:hypothetical protein
LSPTARSPLAFARPFSRRPLPFLSLPHPPFFTYVPSVNWTGVWTVLTLDSLSHQTPSHTILSTRCHTHSLHALPALCSRTHTQYSHMQS